MTTAAETLTVLHLGSGRRDIAATYPHAKIWTLDADYQLRPDLVCELGVDSINLDDNSVDLAHAEHVLEHIGRQGETTQWFAFWEELYRVLKPGGLVRFVAPSALSVWAWADPSHTRALSPESFVFLSQDAYRQPASSISAFRIRCDFERLGDITSIGSNFAGTLRAKKPLQPWWED